MRPRWYFLLGSFLSLISLVMLSAAILFLLNLILFSLEHQQFFSSPRFSLLISLIPLWLPLLAILGLVAGILLLRRYDFSYRHNFSLIIIFLLASLFLGSYLLSRSGLNEYISTRTPMRELYQDLGLTPPGKSLTPNPGQGRGKGSVQGIKQYGRLN